MNKKIKIIASILSLSLVISTASTVSAHAKKAPRDLQVTQSKFLRMTSEDPGDLPVAH